MASKVEGVPVTFTGKGVAEKCSGFDDSGSRMAHKARMTSLEFCKKMEVMVSGKSVTVRINKGLQQCGRNCVSGRGVSTTHLRRTLLIELTSYFLYYGRQCYVLRVDVDVLCHI